VDRDAPSAARRPRIDCCADVVSEIRAFAVSDQPSLPCEVTEVIAPPCREMLLTPDVKARAAELARTHADNAQLSEMLTKLDDGVPCEGMEALIPVLCEGEIGRAHV